MGHGKISDIGIQPVSVILCCVVYYEIKTIIAERQRDGYVCGFCSLRPRCTAYMREMTRCHSLLPALTGSRIVTKKT